MSKDYQKYLVPKEGVLVRHPRSMTIMPKEGQLVDWTGRDGKYWRRRVKDKDCLVSKPPVREAQGKTIEDTQSKPYKSKHNK